MTGLARHLRSAGAGSSRHATRSCSGSAPAAPASRCWWTGDGPLIPLRFLRRLTGIAERVTGAGTEIGAAAHRGRGTTPALPGPPRRPAGDHDRQPGPPTGSPRARTSATIVPEALDRGAIDRLLTLALTLVDAIDADLQRSGPRQRRHPATAGARPERYL